MARCPTCGRPKPPDAPNPKRDNILFGMFTFLGFAAGMSLQLNGWGVILTTALGFFVGGMLAAFSDRMEKPS